MITRAHGAALAATAAVLALSACGSSTAGASGSGSRGKENAGFTKQVQAAIDTAKAPQPALQLSPSKAIPGKRIAIVAVTLAETGALRTAKALAQAAADIGWTSTTYDAQGSPTTANQKLQQALTTRPDAVVLVSLDPTDVGSGLNAARQAGVPVSCAACWDLSAPDKKGSSYADVQPEFATFESLGHLTAQYAYLQTKNHPRFLFMNDPALSNLVARGNGFRQFMKECTEAGGDCSVEASKDFQVANATTTLPAEAAALARAHPKFNAFWMTFDFAGLQALNGLRQANLATGNSSFMVASNGDAPNLDIIKSDGYVKATVAISFEQEAYATVDNLNRILAGKPTVKQTVPVRLFDKSNAGEARDGNWSGDVDYRAAYLASWKG